MRLEVTLMRKRTLRWCVAVTLLVSAGACSREEPQVSTTAAQPAPAPDDASITMAVQSKYYGAEEVRGRDLTVSTRDGVVTVSGAVDSDAAKQRALALAREVTGVTRVEDRLRVEASAANTTGGPMAADRATATDGRTIAPGWITTRIQAQYFIDPELKPWNVEVTTNDEGVVTLEGEVEANEDKIQAVRIARETEGVSRVEDRLRVKGATTAAGTGANTGAVERPDAWLTAKIQSKYFLDDEVKGHEINVETNDGAVTLSGTVGSELQRRQALALARNTEGVRNVIDRLQVDAAASRAGDGQTNPLPPVPELKRPDEWITMKVQAQYFLDQTIKGRQIEVNTRGGVVTLTGSVTSALEKQQAEQIARETDGVRRVVNQLTVGAAGQAAIH